MIVCDERIITSGDGILGRDFLRQTYAEIYFGEDTFKIWDYVVPIVNSANNFDLQDIEILTGDVFTEKNEVDVKYIFSDDSSKEKVFNKFEQDGSLFVGTCAKANKCVQEKIVHGNRISAAKAKTDRESIVESKHEISIMDAEKVNDTKVTPRLQQNVIHSTSAAKANAKQDYNLNCIDNEGSNIDNADVLIPSLINTVKGKFLH